MAKLVKFPFKKEVTDLLSKFRSIPAGAKVKEIFLWELVLNSTRALFKIRCESLFDKSKLATQPELFIHIVPDKTNNTLSIIDSGVGMTKDDLLNRLCTIQDFLQKQHMGTIDKYLKLDATGGGADVDLSWIYADCLRHRLSFFAAYMVADKVLITTKHNGHQQYVWESNGRDSFTIARDTSGDSLLRGTKVTLSLKEDQLEYLEEHRLKGLVETYPTLSTHPYPISISVDNNPATMKPVVDDDKKEEVQFNILQQQFEGLRKTFVKILGHRVKKVVLSDRLFEVSSFLSADMTTLEINPRHYLIERLRKQAEGAKPNDDEVKALVIQQFAAGLGKIYLYRRKYETTTNL